ncbi:MAG: metallophosphoesterase [Planctomycetia bacterium]|nr:metallophosphoesterase [Planctomycetia bacterium]
MTLNINRRSFIGGSLLALCIPSRLFANTENKPIVLRFAALSDVHYDASHNEQSDQHVRLNKALQFMNQYSAQQPYDKFDALVVAGDISNHGVPKEINDFKATLDANLNDATRRVICMGNHEFYGGSRALWEETFQTCANRHQIVNGYHFITISPEKGTCNENDYLYVREWLEQNIKEALADDPKKPVFVVQHYHVRDTVYGSASLPADFHAGVYDLADILQKYPRVVHVSGHSHIPSFDPRSVWQGEYTAIGTGSLSYFALRLYERARNFQPGANVDVDQAGVFLICDVYQDNAIRVRLYDVISDTFLDREYLIAEPGNIAGYIYTNDRFDVAEPPVWRQDAKPEMLETAPYAAAVRFNQARDKFCVVSYQIDAEIDEDGQWRPFDVYNFWSDYFMKEPAEHIDCELFHLKPNSKYRLTINGVNAFQKTTEKPLIIEFATPDDADVDRNAEAPEPNFLNVKFDQEKGMSVTPEPQKVSYAPQFTAPVLVKDATLGPCASFDGKNQAFLFPYSLVHAGKLRDEVSLGLKFRLELDRRKSKERISLFGSTESGGLGFEYEPKTKTLIARVWVENDYVLLEVPFDRKDDVVAFMTYDQKVFKLYLDGKLVASKEVAGAFRLTLNDKAKAFCLGGDVCPKYQVRWFFPGVISRAGVYSWVLKPEQIEKLWL